MTAKTASRWSERPGLTAGIRKSLSCWVPGLTVTWTGTYQPTPLISTGREYETTTPGFPPTAPAELAARPVSQTHVSLSWIDTSTNETGFRVERKSRADDFYSTIGEVGADVTVYDDHTVAARSTSLYPPNRTD